MNNNIPVWIATFINQFVKIEYIDQSQCYGHYPFSYASETAISTNKNIGAMAVGSVVDCFKVFAKELKAGQDKIVMAIDFPMILDAPSDFIGIFYTLDNGKTLELFAIPYNPKDGSSFPYLTHQFFIEQLKKQAEWLIEKVLFD